MKRINFTYLFVGIILLLLGSLAGTGVYYLSLQIVQDQANQIKVSELSQVQEQRNEELVAIAETLEDDEYGDLASIQSPIQETAESQHSPGISLRSLVKTAEKTYDDSERSRKEGFLWIDKSSSQYVITLGALNGVLPGSYLMVYDGQNRIGQVKVETALDVVAYVKPLEDSKMLLQGKYYRVTRE